jgi:hypothetical protein
MFLRLYSLKPLINPSFKIWGICCLVAFANLSFAQETPQQRLVKFFTWAGNPEKIPNEDNCFDGEGLDITGINSKCVQKYLADIQKTGFFSSSYMNSIKKEIAQKQAIVAKKGIAERLDYDRYLLSQDPPSVSQLLYALKTSSTTKVDKNKAKVTVNIKQPYKQILMYNFDLEENIWKISSIQTKE